MCGTVGDIWCRVVSPSPEAPSGKPARVGCGLSTTGFTPPRPYLAYGRRAGGPPVRYQSRHGSPFGSHVNSRHLSQELQARRLAARSSSAHPKSAVHMTGG